MATEVVGNLQTITGTDPRDWLKWRQGSGNTVEIYDIVVGSERRKGFGRALVYKLYKQVPPGTNLVWAITRASNQIAQLFYEELGFRVVAVLRNFYRMYDREGKECVDAIMYGKDLI